MTRWQLYPERIDEADGEPVLREIGGDIVVDAKHYAPVGRTHNLSESIHIDELTSRHMTIIADARNPDPGTKMEDKDYSGFVERGTSDTPAHPFMAPATYKYRG